VLNFEDGLFGRSSEIDHPVVQSGFHEDGGLFCFFFVILYLFGVLLKSFLSSSSIF